MAKKPSNTAPRSQYALRFYGSAKKHVEAGTMGISLEDLRKVLGLESIKDVEGNVISGTAFADLGELPPESVGYCDRGDQ